MKYGLALVVALLLAGCAKNIDTEDAVKQSVLKDIASKVDVSAMDVNVDSVSFRDKEADAQISFRPKGAAVSQGIIMKYSLKRQGDEWKIASRNMEAGHDQNPAALPPGHPSGDPSAK